MVIPMNTMQCRSKACTKKVTSTDAGTWTIIKVPQRCLQYKDELKLTHDQDCCQDGGQERGQVGDLKNAMDELHHS